MAKRNLKSALTNSLKAEDNAVRDRFEKADSLLGEKQSANNESLAAEKQTEVTQTEAVPQKKVVRDTFTMPTEDYELIGIIQQRCLQSAYNATRSEIVRAGIKLLNELSDEKLLQALKAVEKIKTGRPSRKKV